MTLHIMLDLETWGTKPGCDIRSIGAVQFEPDIGLVTTGENKRFYMATTGGEAYGLTRDANTVEWWEQQSDAAKDAFKNPYDISIACRDLFQWFPPTPPEHIRVWAQDPDFDCSILAAAFDALGVPVPWHYRSPRSFRTIVDLAGIGRDEYCKYGEAHNAVDDAIAQALTVCEAYRRLGLAK